MTGGIPQSPVGYEDFAGYDASTINIRAGLDIQLSPMFQLDIGFTHGTSKASQARMIQKVENYMNAIQWSWVGRIAILPPAWPEKADASSTILS